ncbi:MAG: NUDIX hydrolase [Planctomycetes bacterium]|nr:NUDIX hydrolase [Planctomycetota bacterium]
MSRRFTLLKSRTLHPGRIVRLDRETWRAPDGSTFSRDTIVHPGAVAILPLTARGTFLFLRQFRAAARGWLLEIPAGTLEKGESPLGCAKRELIEETGFAARGWKLLGSILVAPGYTTEVIHLFEARDLSPAHAAQDDDEHIEVEEMTRAGVEQAAKSGRIRDGKSLSAMLLSGRFRAGISGTARRRARKGKSRA